MPRRPYNRSVFRQSRRWAVLLSLLATSPARGEERPKFADTSGQYDSGVKALTEFPGGSYLRLC
jgi:hypothetical protein